jgi:hypothetical protein
MVEKVRKAKPRTGVTLWRAYHDWHEWVIVSQGVEMTDKTVYFDGGDHHRGDRFSDFNSQKPIAEVDEKFGRSPQEAREKTITILTAERDHLLEKVNQLNADIIAVHRLRDPIEPAADTCEGITLTGRCNCPKSAVAHCEIHGGNWCKCYRRREKEAAKAT